MKPIPHPPAVPSRPARRFALQAFGVAGAATLAALLVGGLTTPPSHAGAEAAVAIPAYVPDPAAAAAMPAASETAVFAGGCFWGVQAVFQHTRGVLGAVSGYAGGGAATARYEMIGTGLTGHAEAVRVAFDPRQVTYAQLLQIFFSVAHDPTQLDRQGPDRGPQYRSALFPADAAQRAVAERYIAQLDAVKVYPSKIVTRVAAAAPFYPAEGYHQDYATLHPESPYIATFDAPKLVHLKAMFAARYRPDPVLVNGTAAPARRP